MVGFQCISVLHDEVLRTTCPGWQSNIMDLLLQVVQTQFKTAFVLQEAPITKEELRCELFVVRKNIHVILPGYVDVVENLIRWSTY